MFSIVTEFLLALDGNFDLGRCLSHVGTEGGQITTEVDRRLHAVIATALWTSGVAC